MLSLALALQLSMAQQCAPNVSPATMRAIVSVESSNNPYAIGVVGGQLPRQPRSKDEALAAVADLERQGKNFSMGLAQVNKHNLPRYGISAADAFDPCTNLRVGGQILEDCYRRASRARPEPQAALRAAFSCYYSGNFLRGFVPDKPGHAPYVDKVVAEAGVKPATQIVPAIEPYGSASAVAGAPAAPRRPEGSVLIGDDVAVPAAPSPAAEPFAELADVGGQGGPARLSVASEAQAGPAAAAPIAAPASEPSTLVF